nr:MAG TPA: thymidylate kinase [Caudoviricetes sp.]
MTKQLIIVDGPDNTGKDTAIADILTQFPNAVVQRFVGTDKMGVDALKYQIALYKDFIASLSSPTSPEVIICNRCWVDEMVYGPLYRNEDYVACATMVFDMFDNIPTDISVKYIYLTAPVNFLVSNDDALSLSNASSDLMSVELQVFDVAFSILNNHDTVKAYKVCVAKGDNTFIDDFHDIILDIARQ